MRAYSFLETSARCLTSSTMTAPGSWNRYPHFGNKVIKSRRGGKVTFPMSPLLEEVPAESGHTKMWRPTVIAQYSINWVPLAGCFLWTQWPRAGPRNRHIHLCWHQAYELQQDPECQLHFCSWQRANYKAPPGQMPYGTRPQLESTKPAGTGGIILRAKREI